MTERTADLHLHTHYSDGTWTPTEVVQRAVAHGLSAIALTDHDTIGSFAEVHEAAQHAHLECIPGVEVSTQIGSLDVHVLAYFVDVTDAAFQAWLTELAAARLRRLDETLRRLGTAGVPLAKEVVLALAGPGTIGRLHVARALVQQGMVPDVNTAFHRYLSSERPAYVPDAHPTPEEAIQRLRAARGVPVLAHPQYLKDEALVPSLVRAGIAGLEVYHPSHDVGQQARYRRIAEEHGLVMTGGSDCHGTAKGQPLIGSVKLPYTYVEELRRCHAQICAA